jgi:Dual specificity phosphatase, catalytic domain
MDTTEDLMEDNDPEKEIFLSSKLLAIDLFYELKPSSNCQWVHVSKIEDDIYLGGVMDPKDDALIADERNMDPMYAPHSVIEMYDIGLVISFTDSEVIWNFTPEVYSLHFVLPDYVFTNIKQCFPLCIKRIQEARENKKKIFIHCAAGISRSTTALCAYYLYTGLPDNYYPTVKDVVRFIQSKRQFVIPNAGFLKQLEEFYDQMNEK